MKPLVCSLDQILLKVEGLGFKGKQFAKHAINNMQSICSMIVAVVAVAAVDYRDYTFYICAINISDCSCSPMPFCKDLRFRCWFIAASSCTRFLGSLLVWQLALAIFNSLRKWCIVVYPFIVVHSKPQTQRNPQTRTQTPFSQTQKHAKAKSARLAGYRPLTFQAFQGISAGTDGYIKAPIERFDIDAYTRTGDDWQPGWTYTVHGGYCKDWNHLESNHAARVHPYFFCIFSHLQCRATLEGEELPMKSLEALNPKIYQIQQVSTGFPPTLWKIKVF